MCNHTSDKEKRTTAKRKSDLQVTSMITYKNWNHSYDYKPNWPPLGTITIIKAYNVLIVLKSGW